jgi:cobalamin biosynthesis Co2+ chelatase CbiK
MVSEKPFHKPSTATESLIGRELGRIADKFQQTNNRLHRSQTIEDCTDAEDERREIAGEFWAAEHELAHLYLLLRRLAQQHEPDAVKLYAIEAIRPELQPIVESLAKMEIRLVKLEGRRS